MGISYAEIEHPFKELVVKVDSFRDRFLSQRQGLAQPTLVNQSSHSNVGASQTIPRTDSTYVFFGNMPQSIGFLKVALGERQTNPRVHQRISKTRGPIQRLFSLTQPFFSFGVLPQANIKESKICNSNCTASLPARLLRIPFRLNAKVSSGFYVALYRRDNG